MNAPPYHYFKSCPRRLMISALTAMRFAIHRSEVEVPKLVGMTPADATRAVENLGLSMDAESNYFSPDVAEGRVVSQIPSPGTQVRRGWRVRTALSLGPQRIAIPDVTGQTERSAEINLRRRGLEMDRVVILPLPGSDADRVAAQAPPAGANSASVPKVSLLESGDPEPMTYVMPKLVGETFASASSSLQDAGLRLGSVRVRPSTNEVVSDEAVPSPSLSQTTPSPAAIVVGQVPAAGERVVAGQAATLELQE